MCNNIENNNDLSDNYTKVQNYKNTFNVEIIFVRGAYFVKLLQESDR